MGNNVMRAFQWLARVLLPLVLSFSLVVVAFAAGAAPPHSVIEDGKTILRTFKVSVLSPEAKQLFAEIMASPRSVILSNSDGSYWFLNVPVGDSLTIVNGDTPQAIDINVTGGTIYRALKFYRSGSDFVVYDSQIVTGNGFSNVSSIVGGNYWKSYNNFPTLSYDYLADITGALVIETDEVDGGGTGGEDSGGGILDWLTDFWAKLVEVFKGLFIPSADYLSNFFNDIKNAFDAKLGGFGNLLDSLSNALGSLKSVSVSSSLVIKLPDNFLFNGYDGISVDVLKPFSSLILFIRNIFNAFLVVMTVIICYHKIIKIVNV